jgi:hypothetical protein
VTYSLAEVLKICDCQVRAREGNGVAADDTRVSSAIETGQAISWQPAPMSTSATSTSVVELARVRAAKLREQAQLLKSSEQVCVCPRARARVRCSFQ